MKLVIIDYQLGNLFSVQQAVRQQGFDCEVSADPEAVRQADALLLPGVGAFGAAMEALRRDGLEEAILEGVNAGKPFMGVCLGMQLLFAKSGEFGEEKGLGIIPGEIKRIPGEGRKVPHVGWNTIRENGQSWAGSPLEGLADGAWMYFVHSYHAQPDEAAHALTHTTHDGFTYCSAVRRDNVFATQFHPEKSAAPGLSIYANWLNSI